MDAFLSKNNKQGDNLTFTKNEIIKLTKIKTSFWNRILNIGEFDHFSDIEYFRWKEIYQDSSHSLDTKNPSTIEQKIAIIEVITKNINYLTSKTDTQFTKEILQLNLYKTNRISQLLTKTDLSKKLTKEELNSFSIELMLLLKGPPIHLLDYFTKNRSERLNIRLIRMLEEDLLLLGLKGMLQRIPEKDNVTALNKINNLSQRFLKNKTWKYFVFPLDLPWLEKVQIPEELLNKIIVEGLDVHNQELIEHLKKQNMIDHYERFRKVYKPMALSLALYYFYSKDSNELIESSPERIEEKNKFLAEFNNMADSVMKTKEEAMRDPEEVEFDVRDKQFQRVLNKFREKYKEEPTSEEYLEMKQSIFK